MNPHITLGFPDDQGRGKPSVVIGPEVPVQKQMQAVMEAKAKGKPIKNEAFLAVCPIGNAIIKASFPPPAPVAPEPPPAPEPAKHTHKAKA